MEQGGRFEIGRVVGRTFQVIGANTLTFLALAVLLEIPTIVYNYLFMAGQFAVFEARALVGTYVVSRACHTLVRAAVTQGTIATLNGGKASLGECLTTSLRHALPLMAIVFLALLGIVIGLVLLVVPGVILACMWAVAIPARVVERTSVEESFGRSNALTRGHRWPIFGLFAIFWIASALLGVAARLLSRAPLGLPSASSAVYWTLTLLLSVVLSTVSAAGIASIYYELRLVKEGGEPEHLAQVFA